MLDNGKHSSMQLCVMECHHRMLLTLNGKLFCKITIKYIYLDRLVQFFIFKIMYTVEISALRHCNRNVSFFLHYVLYTFMY